MFFMINLLSGYSYFGNKIGAEPKGTINLETMIVIIIPVLLALYQLISIMFQKVKSPKAKPKSFRPSLGEDGITTHQRFIRIQQSRSSR